MTYVATDWTPTTRISAHKLNNLETIYDEVMALSTTWNNHDSLYYTKLSANTKFFSTSYMGLGSGADADLLDGYHSSSIVGNGLPVGAIMWWNADLGTIPGGWHQCDGGAGTTDYRDLFVLGSKSGTYTLKSSYGANTVTPTSYSVTVGWHALTEAELPAHVHSIVDYYGYNVVTWLGGAPTYLNDRCADAGTTYRTTDATGGGGGHTHAGSTVTFSSESNVPPYYAMYLIQKLS